MSGLASIDLNQIGVDAESFLGRALALGREFEKLPPGAESGLATYLRLQGTLFARRYRSGIALDRDGLAQGVRRAFISIELALEEEAQADLNRAVDLLGQPGYEGWRKKGWELAHYRLEEMRRGSLDWSDGPKILLLKDCRAEIEVWTRIETEAWQSTDFAQDDAGERVQLDPRRDYLRFKQVECQAVFAASLPSGAVADLLEVEPEGITFGALLRQALAGVLLGVERLLLTGAESATAALVCKDPDLCRQAVEVVAGQLDRIGVEELYRTTVVELLREELALLGAAAPDEIETLLVTRG
jgi:hypothetical protein